VPEVRTHYLRGWIVLSQGSIVTDLVLSQWVGESVKRMNDPRVVWFASRHFTAARATRILAKMQHLEIADDLEAELRKLLEW